MLRRVSTEPRRARSSWTAAGPAFSAGHDLSEMIGRDARFYQRAVRRLHRADGDDPGVPQPVIAKVHGIATAAGCQLVAACDLAVAAEQAPASPRPGVKIGLFCSTPMVPLSRVDRPQARAARCCSPASRSTPPRRSTGAS